MEVGRGVGLTTTSTTTMPASSPPWQTTVPTPCERSKVQHRHPQTVTLLPISWDIIVSIYRELVNLINRLPFKKKLIVCIVYRGSKFRLDLGEVKAAGVVCLIGLGLSLGTLLLYRIYFRIVVPFLHSVWAARGKNSLLDDEYTLYLEPSDSEVDDKMGNSNSKKATPSVYYAPGYGVTLGARPPSLSMDNSDEFIHPEGVRLRPRKSYRSKSPSPGSDKDSAIGVGGSEMSQSLYSENSANRDSFYSTGTMESGFDDLGFLEELKTTKLCGSMKENFGPNYLKQRNLQMLYRAHRGHDAGLNSLGHSAKPGLETLSDCSSERSGIMSCRSFRSSCDGDSNASKVCTRTNIDPLVEKLTSDNGISLRTDSRQSRLSQDRSSHGHLSMHSQELGPSSNGAMLNSYSDADHVLPHARCLSNESSPYHRGGPSRSNRGRSPLHSLNHPQLLSQSTQSDWLYGNDSNMDYDPSLDASESIRSFNSSIDDIEWDEDNRDRMSTLPQFQESLSDFQFKQSLMQRIHEWSNFAEEYNKSRSPTPDCSPIRFVRRSRSLDRHIGDPSLLPIPDPTESKPIEIEPTTERHLETLEYELHDIQGEFESITSKLHELIEQGNADFNTKSSNYAATASPKRGARVESTPRATDPKLLLRKMRTQWDHVPSSACSDSSRSSQTSSVEYAWDLGDYKHNTNVGDRPRADSRASDNNHLANRGLAAEEICSHSSQADVINIGVPIAISTYAEHEWKGDTDKARLIQKGYSKIPQRLACHRMCVIRGDNYCALRSVLFQVLVSGQRVTQCWSGIIGIMDSLHDLLNDPEVGFCNWTFANRLPHHCKDRLASLSKCALSLYATIEEVCNLPSREEREKRTIGLFNTSATFDLELMEGLKVMMLLTLVNLKRRVDDGEEVPIFVHLLFARDTSQTISQFVSNHLNCVGDSGGLEQVEMCLLGYTLGVRVRVLRLAQCQHQDFDCFFPEDVPSDWPEVDLIAEDDRHYNVPLP